MSDNIKEIYFAGGCFWGTQAYFNKVPGVVETDVGYANGKTKNPSYKELAQTGHAETVRVVYDRSMVGLKTLLKHFFNIIDPTLLNRQGGDVGTQYRTGIYYVDDEDLDTIRAWVRMEQRKYKEPIVTEIMKLDNYYPAEEYHQDYLDKNPGGYCHIDMRKVMEIPFVDARDYKPVAKEELRKRLDDLKYKVACENHTERPFENEYWNVDEKGIYVDIATGEPLFLSKDKFDAGCGWASFSNPISEDVIVEVEDLSHGMRRVEVRSRVGDIHLGHVFDDGPDSKGGRRYCINSASIRFIPEDKMEEEGYGQYLRFIK